MFFSDFLQKTLNAQKDLVNAMRVFVWRTVSFVMVRNIVSMEKMKLIVVGNVNIEDYECLCFIEFIKRVGE